ncbi:phosphohydrolase [Candidatus Thiomargarita nelsonii]|uniref:Phosphohydrolase n=1 Tax=Candidatus Thiomargarita nelsonii TaxID=1003181 RepID=A0A0A6RWZ4_9GAMM|nr:phosphohydrolase [Candidatus Thiomargarita nelsonii]
MGFKSVKIQDLFVRLKTLNQIGIALSAEKDGTRLQEMILKEAKRIADADGGTLYLRDKDQLKFEIMLNDTLNIHKGGTSGVSVKLPSLPMYKDNGQPHLELVAVCAAYHGQTINIHDAYANTEFEFSGPHAFDKKHNYRSKSFLTVPMKNHDGEVIGVLQLINALEPGTQEKTSFSDSVQELVESLASQGAVALVNQQLLEEQRRFFKTFIQVIATAIDEKSPHTSEHCQRVPILTLMLAEAAAKIQIGPLKDFSMTDEDREELKVAALLHDCGKITTPEYVIDKATKLKTFFDRIHLIDTRFEVLKRDAEIACLREQLAGESVDIEAKLAQKIETLNEEREFLHHCNMGSEFMSDALKKRVLQIAQRQWKTADGSIENFLSQDEIDNLNITKGTLTADERKIINRHIDTTINMLESLHYPKYLQHVPEYAGGHHEHMDGTGYPKKLKREQMSIPARIMGIADVFEALTSSDRPYNQKPKPLSEALMILGQMKKDNHLDPDLFDLFIHEKIYLHYADSKNDKGKPFLTAEQIDEVDVTQLPGYNPL